MRRKWEKERKRQRIWENVILCIARPKRCQSQKNFTWNGFILYSSIVATSLLYSHSLTVCVCVYSPFRNPNPDLIRLSHSCVVWNVCAEKRDGENDEAHCMQRYRTSNMQRKRDTKIPTNREIRCLFSAVFESHCIFELHIFDFAAFE